MSTIAYAALWIYVFSVPWERILVLPGVSIIAKLTGGLAAALAVLAAVSTGRFRRWHPFHVLVVLFVGWAGVVLLVLATGSRLPGKFWTWPQLFVAVWMLWELGTTERRLRGLFTAYLLGGYVAAIDTIRVSRYAAEQFRRYAAGGSDPNEVAVILALGIPMAWYLGLTYRSVLLRWIARAYVPLAVVAIGLTGSRGGLVATTVALLIIPLAMTRLSPARLGAAILVLVLAGALAVAYTPDRLVERFASTTAELEGGRIGGRGKLWRAGLRAFAERPLLGYGTGAFRQAVTPMLGDAAQTAHNSFISVMVEQGIVGLLLYVAIFVVVFRALLRLPRLERRFALVLYGTLLVAMLPLTWEDHRAVWIVLPSLLGLAHVPVWRRSPAQPVPAPAPASLGRPGVVGSGEGWRRSRDHGRDATA